MHALANLYGTNPILDVASHLDAGLTPDLLATSISTAHRFRPTEFPIPAEDVPDMLAFFTAWREQLLGSSPAEDDASQQGPDEQDTTPLAGETRMACTITCTRSRRRRLGPSLPGDPS